METLIENFQLDWKLILAQMLNFAIVVTVLYLAAYKPLLKVMNERTGKIEKGLEDAKLAQAELESAQKTKAERILEAKKEAREMINEAQKQGEKNQQLILEKAKKQAEVLLQKARAQIEEDKNRAMKEIKAEIGALVLQASRKILDREISPKDHEKMVADFLKS